MKAIILAAWYATRLFPLTENFPKPLIEIWWKPIINHILEKLETINITEANIITNNKYFEHFVKRKNKQKTPIKINILNDKTLNHKDKLWAIWDTLFTIENWNINEDTLIICWDNLFKFDLTKAYNLFQETKKAIIISYDVKDIENAKNFWVIETNWNKIINFEEKPQNPTSTLISSCIYFFPKKTLLSIKKYISDWNNEDAIWLFIKRLLSKEELLTYSYESERYDIWTFNNLENAKKSFS